MWCRPSSVAGDGARVGRSAAAARRAGAAVVASRRIGGPARWRRRRRRALLLALALPLPLLAHIDLGRSAGAQYDIEIVAIDLAGRQTNLTRDPALDVAPAVSRDGRIAFMSMRGGSPDLYVMDGDGGDVRRVTNGPVDHSGVALAEDLAWSEASWSPRGRIAFDGKYQALSPPCEQHCAGWRVLAIGSDGRGLEQVELGVRAPAWSPDGRRIAYESGVDADYRAHGVTITRSDGLGSVRLKALNGQSDVGPVWSPSGRELAFQARPGENARSWIYTVRADGTRRRGLAAGQGPSWSPDGRRLAFVEDGKLFTIGADGKRRRMLSRKGESVVDAAWSPRGATIAYVAGTRAGSGGGLPQNLRVETARADGKRVHVLVREPGTSSIWGSPVWTPDGRRILVAVEAH